MLFRRCRNVSIFSCGLLGALLSARSGLCVDLSKLVVVGDSISAGVQNFSLEQDQQPHGYASIIANQAVIAKQANAQPLTLPLVPWPGVPNVLQLTSLAPVTVIPSPDSSPVLPRSNPCAQPTNVSVPGVTLQQALTMTPGPLTAQSSPVQGWVNVVLGFPNPFGISLGLCPGSAAPPLSEVQQAVALNPTAVITWLGNNDVLVPAITGALNTITPLTSFASSYQTLLDTLGKTKAPILTVTIPDVTKIAFFTPLTVVAKQVNMNVNAAAQKLGLDPGDLLRPTAVPIALAILENQPNAGSVTGMCPAPPIAAALTPVVPCVLKENDANLVRATVDLFNTVIVAESLLHGDNLVDIHALVDNLSQTGYTADGKHLTTAFLGGLFSFDGVHPTNTGYGIIANAFINIMNQRWGTSIPQANINTIAAADPLLPPISPAALPLPKPPAGN